VVPAYGGGMSSAKAQLESDTRVLAWEAGRNYGIRVNCISAGPLKSRAASAIAKGDKRTFIEVGIDYYLANAPLQKNLYSDDVGSVAAAMCSPAFNAVTGEMLYVDNGMHAMGWATEQAGEKLWARADALDDAELMGDKYTKSAETMAKYTEA
jgi:enoyl-[acyl-carrier protein] reductase I